MLLADLDGSDDVIVCDVAMPADRYAEIILARIAARERFIVSHAYDLIRSGEQTAALEVTFARSGPRCNGETEFDGRAYVERLCVSWTGLLASEAVFVARRKIVRRSVA